MSTRAMLSILMAEDDVDDQVLLRDAFRDSGIDVALEFVPDGVELMARLNHILSAPAEQLPDLLLLDLNMPRMDGREALHAIREHEGLKHLPVIVLTTSQARLDILASYQLGANSFVTKPRRFEDLIAILRSLERYWIDIVQLPSRKEGQET
ncbi:MAG: response regulator [Rhodanobacter sp.]